MTLQVEFWQLVSFAGALLGAFAGVAQLLLARTHKHQEEREEAQELARSERHKVLVQRLNGIEQVNRDDALQWQRVEREMLRFQAEMPMTYVMRDDYIRGQSIIEAKLDGLADKLEKAQLRSLLHGGKS